MTDQLTVEELIEDIVVEGYSQRYVDAVRDVLGIEGGYVNDPVDRGGATKYGISLRFLVAEGQVDRDGDGFADFDLDMDGDIDGQDIRKLKVGDAIWLYHEFFWKRFDCDVLPKPIGEAVFDQAVNGGGFAAKKMLQQAINRFAIHPLYVDGNIGPITIEQMHGVIAMANVGIEGLMEAYREQVRLRYHAIVRRNPSQRRFLRGWMRRADKLGCY